jgi:hypothetical protein
MASFGSFGQAVSEEKISWRSVLLVEEIEVPGEKHRPAASHIML